MPFHGRRSALALRSLMARAPLLYQVALTGSGNRRRQNEIAAPSFGQFDRRDQRSPIFRDRGYIISFRISSGCGRGSSLCKFVPKQDISPTIGTRRNWGNKRLRHPSRTVHLISCVSKKRLIPAPARDLYISDWLLKAREYVERTQSPWFILSAKYGLVRPDRIQACYNITLNSMSPLERWGMGERVKAQMESSLPATDRIVVLAGLRYREFLMDYLRQRALAVEVPMEGLSIGRQLHFLAQALHYECV
jgi:hypothetical protein